MYNLNYPKICARYKLLCCTGFHASPSPSRHLSRLPRGDITSWTCGPMPNKYTYTYKSNPYKCTGCGTLCSVYRATGGLDKSAGPLNVRAVCPFICTYICTGRCTGGQCKYRWMRELRPFKCNINYTYTYK